MISRCPFTVKTEKKESGVHQHRRSAFSARLAKQMLLSSLLQSITVHTPQPLRMCLIGHQRIDMKVYQGKPVVMLSTSPGPGGASSVLSSAVHSAPYFDADVKGSMSVPSFYDNFNVETGEIINAEIARELEIDHESDLTASVSEIITISVRR